MPDLLEEMFEDIKRVMRRNKLKKTDNLITERKGTKRQTMVHKTLHRKLDCAP